MDPNNQRPQISTHRSRRVVPRGSAGSDIIRPRPNRPEFNPSVPATSVSPVMPLAQQPPQPSFPPPEPAAMFAQPTPQAQNPTADIVSPVFGSSLSNDSQPPLNQTTNQATPQTEGQQPIQSPYSQLSVDPGAVPKQKSPLPKGIYVLIGLMMISVVLNFFHASNIGDINTLVIIIEILVALGLLTRHNIARRALMVISAFYLVLSVVFIVDLVMIQNKVKTAEKNYNQAVAKLQKSELTDQGREWLANNQTEINNLKKQAGKNITRSYIYQFLSIAEASLIIWYLTRPKVKAAFTAT